VYIFDPYFINIGRACGLLSDKENKALSLIKNKWQNLCIGTPTKYHDLFILGYRDGMGMSCVRVNEIIDALESSMPSYFEFRRNAKAQIAGFRLARKNKFGY
jgi:hypothetical protein